MLDYPRKTEELLALLEDAVPFEVEIAPAVIKQLRDYHATVAEKTRYVVSKLSYAGDEGGIMCHLIPPQGQEVVVISLTYVRTPRPMTLAAPILAYQRHRLKKLKKQAR